MQSLRRQFWKHLHDRNDQQYKAQLSKIKLQILQGKIFYKLELNHKVTIEITLKAFGIRSHIIPKADKSKLFE